MVMNYYQFIEACKQAVKHKDVVAVDVKIKLSDGIVINYCSHQDPKFSKKYIDYADKVYDED